MKRDMEGMAVCIVSLGYVGLPVAEAFAKGLNVIGFGTNGDKIRELNRTTITEILSSPMTL